MSTDSGNISSKDSAHSEERAADVVQSFLLTLQEGDIEGALGFLDDEAVWINVSLPTVRGKRRIANIFRQSSKLGGGFRVIFHAIASEGDVVLTDRTDEINVGRFQHRFWVTGRFEVRDGKIVVWRDSFDWGDLLVGLARAVAGIVWPRLNRPWPDGAH